MGRHLSPVPDEGDGKPPGLQLSLKLFERPPKVGGRPELPLAATVAMSGKLEAIHLERELYQDEDVTVTITDAKGRVVARGPGTVKKAGTRRDEAGDVSWLTREHTIKLG